MENKENKNIEVECCPDGCDCQPTNTSKSTSIIKLAIFLVVIVAIGGIVAYKLLSDNGVADNNSGGFAVQGGNTNPANNGETQDVYLNFGTRLDSFDDLNDGAADDKAIFLFIPDADNNAADETTRTASSTAQRNLNNSGTITSLYAINTESDDYTWLAEQFGTSTVVVLVRGGGANAISCNGITEEKLLEAYLSSCDPAACDPSGCC